MLLSKCCHLTKSSITKRFYLPHTHRGKGKVCVRALVPLKSLCVAYTFFFFNADVCVSEGVWVWAGLADICEGSDNSKNFYNNFISIYSIVCSDTCEQENKEVCTISLKIVFKNTFFEKLELHERKWYSQVCTCIVLMLH